MFFGSHVFPCFFSPYYFVLYNLSFSAFFSLTFLFSCLFLFVFVFSFFLFTIIFWRSSPSLDQAQHIAWSVSTNCPFGPDPCAPTTGQRSRCNRHSQPTHQTYGETCRWWIATEPCLPELCPTFDFVSGFVRSLSCYSPGSYSLLLELSLSTLRRRARGSFQQDHPSPLFIHMQSLQARVWVKFGFSMISDARTVHKKPGKNAAERIATGQPRVSP